MFGYLGNFQSFENFSKILKIYHPQKSGYLGNFPDTQAFGKFPRYPGIWEISQIPRLLGNFTDIQAFWKFPKFLFEGGISLRFWIFGGFPNPWGFGKFLFLTFLIVHSLEPENVRFAPIIIF